MTIIARRTRTDPCSPRLTGAQLVLALVFTEAAGSDRSGHDTPRPRTLCPIPCPGAPVPSRPCPPDEAGPQAAWCPALSPDGSARLPPAQWRPARQHHDWTGSAPASMIRPPRCCNPYRRWLIPTAVLAEQRILGRVGRRSCRDELLGQFLQVSRLFVEKAVDVIGLYHHSPERAAVLCTNKKSQVRALGRSRLVWP